MGTTRLGGCEYIESENDSIAEAVTLAGETDIPIVIVGTDKGWECEGDDRSTIDLPRRQAELVERVCKANASTVCALSQSSHKTKTNPNRLLSYRLACLYRCHSSLQHQQSCKLDLGAKNSETHLQMYCLVSSRHPGDCQ
jgi:hypothetical protein